MVAKIAFGKSIRGILTYNENKVSQGQASLILASGFAADINRLSLYQKINRFTKLTSLNTRAKTNAMHISLNFDPSDKLDQHRLQQIAQSYMEQIGFSEQPYIVYQHTDAAHPHIHIATTIIKKDSKRKYTQYFGRDVSEPARKNIEKQYALVKAEGRKQDQSWGITPAVYGSKPTKQAINSVLKAVVDNYSFTSLAEFNAILGQFNIRADRGGEDTKMFQKNGLQYCLLDENKEPIGVPIKASSFYSQPTLANLEKKFLKGIEERKPLKENLKDRIDQQLSKYNSITRATFQREVARAQVAVVFRQNQTGFIYGVTYIDHKQKTVFNGSDLGNDYKAKAITARFSHEDEIKTYIKRTKDQPAQEKKEIKKSKEQRPKL
ncbi:relaxase/mobilization nuclease domain-containing protein [Pedobacter sp. UC225_61]|uniref:relaxase/mobilization nuclease domain-containing protein n=1 Tax=Pedobacter sp. UC225_61 TaxID=3374623 RepID=UPI00378FAF74